MKKPSPKPEKPVVERGYAIKSLRNRFSPQEWWTKPSQTPYLLAKDECIVKVEIREVKRGR